MLNYQSKPIPAPETQLKFVASIIFGSTGSALGLWMWWQLAPGIWTLATFNPSGPIRPLGFMAALVLFMFGGGLNALLLGVPAGSLSKRRSAQIVATLAALSSALPFLNFVAFFVIIFVRRIQLGD